MASVLGNYTIATKTATPLTDQGIALLSAFSTTTAQATSDMLQPALTMKAPKKNPVFEGTATFTGTTSGIKASDVVAVDGFTNSNVQIQLNKKVDTQVLVDTLAPITTTLNGKANLSAADFTGKVTAPTVTPTTDSATNVATTAFVQSAIAGKADKNNPDLTGTVTAPTVTPTTDSSTKVATTAFVQSVGNTKKTALNGTAQQTLTVSQSGRTAGAELQITSLNNTENSQLK